MRDEAARNNTTGWKPIKTVPKNKLVLVGTTDPRGNFGCRVVVSRLQKHQQRLVTGKFWGWDHTGAEWTHWMPFPDPPECADGK